MRRADLSGPGIRRRRCGRGFAYRWHDGRTVTEPDVQQRVRSLAVPPAWQEVWICPWPNGHIQAVGTDVAGRRQYLYHDVWRQQRDADKHDRVLRLAARLPRARRVIAEHLAERGLSRKYAQDNGTYGLATMLKEHATIEGESVVFTYPAKGSQERVQAVVDPAVRDVVRALKRRRGGDELLAYYENRQWRDVRSSDINEYLRDLLGGEWTAKDFRTWHATVLTAVGLAVSTRADATRSARKRAVTRVVREVAEYLGDTLAIARKSYVDPRVIDLYEDGITVAGALHALGDGTVWGHPATHGKVEAAVLRLLRRPPSR